MVKNNRKRKPKYPLGIVHNGKEIITVKKIYPPGHKCATTEEYGYLIYSTDIGEDELLERSLGRLIALAE